MRDIKEKGGLVLVQERFFAGVDLGCGQMHLNFPLPSPRAAGIGSKRKTTHKPPLSLQSAAEQLILQRYSWPAVLVTRQLRNRTAALALTVGGSWLVPLPALVH